MVLRVSRSGTSKKGSVAAFLAAAFAICPVCIPSYVAIMSSIGLGVVVRPSVARILVMVFIGLAIGVLAWNWRYHRSWWPLIIACVGGFLLVWFRYGSFHPELITLGAVLLAVSTVMDYYRRRYAQGGRLGSCPVE